MPLNSPTCCLPNIVASGSILQRTSSLTQTLLTAPANGLYALYLYCAENGSGSVALSVAWQDDYASQSSTANSVVMEVKAGAAVILTATVTGTPTFNIYYCLVSLV